MLFDTSGMRRPPLIFFSSLLGFLLLGPVARARAPERGAPRGVIDARALCPVAIGAAERTLRLPPALLGAIGTVESGRRDPASGKLTPWPWTVNAEGQGYFHGTKAEAIAAVERLRAAGVRSIDVGCMQVNLLHHPEAFDSLEQAFDPHANAGYAARFLVSLHRETADWMQAAAAYHSRTPELGGRYRQRVAAVWPQAPRDAVPGGSERGIERVRVDPRGIYTPEFAARLLQNARDRAARDAAMRGGPAPRSGRYSQVVTPKP